MTRMIKRLPLSQHIQQQKSISSVQTAPVGKHNFNICEFTPGRHFFIWRFHFHFQGDSNSLQKPANNYAPVNHSFQNIFICLDFVYYPSLDGSP